MRPERAIFTSGMVYDLLLPQRITSDIREQKFKSRVPWCSKRTGALTMNASTIATVLRYFAAVAIAVPIVVGLAWAIGIVNASTTSAISFASAICGAVFVTGYFVATDHFLEHRH
jgi:hypothetical protein